MVKRSREYCISGGSDSGFGGDRGGRNRRSGLAVTFGALALYIIFLCGNSVSGASFGDDRSAPQYVAGASLAQVPERTAAGAPSAAARYADDGAAAAAGSAARSSRSAANLSHITGTARKIKMFIKNRYLQVFPDGTVNSTAEDTNDYGECLCIITIILGRDRLGCA